MKCKTCDKKLARPSVTGKCPECSKENERTARGVLILMIMDNLVFLAFITLVVAITVFVTRSCSAG